MSGHQNFDYKGGTGDQEPGYVHPELPEFTPHDGKCLVCARPSPILVLCDSCRNELESNAKFRDMRRSAAIRRHGHAVVEADKALLEALRQIES